MDAFRSTSSFEAEVPGIPGHWHAEHAELPDAHDGEDDNLWSVPWSDLMMVMFVIFAALFSLEALRNAELVQAGIAQDRQSQPQAVQAPAEPASREGKPQAPAPAVTMQALARVDVYRGTRQAIADSGVRQVEVLLLKDRSVHVNVSGQLLFESGQVDLRPSMTPLLDHLAALIRRTSFRIEVIGHTDDQVMHSGLYPSNWELSSARASRVVRYLVEQSGASPSRFSAIGRASYAPLKPNTSNENRSENRRVEIVFLDDASGEGAKP